MIYVFLAAIVAAMLLFYRWFRVDDPVEGHMSCILGTLLIIIGLFGGSDQWETPPQDLIRLIHNSGLVYTDKCPAVTKNTYPVKVILPHKKDQVYYLITTEEGDFLRMIELIQNLEKEGYEIRIQGE